MFWSIELGWCPIRIGWQLHRKEHKSPSRLTIILCTSRLYKLGYMRLFSLWQLLGVLYIQNLKVGIQLMFCTICLFLMSTWKFLLFIHTLHNVSITHYLHKITTLMYTLLKRKKHSHLLVPRYIGFIFIKVCQCQLSFLANNSLPHIECLVIDTIGSNISISLSSVTKVSTHHARQLLFLNSI